MSKQQYAGSAYIGVVGNELEYGISRDSIEAIARRPDDAVPLFIRATKGYEARQKHINRFMASHHDFILLLDADQTFPPDTLKRLRDHGLPYVTGFYMRRSFDTMAPVWFRPFSGKWPMEPWVGVPEAGRLHKLGAAGWGCMLIHRDVITDTRRILKGEWDVLEDDMDVWPYNLERFVDAVNMLQVLIDHRTLHHVTVQSLLDVIKDEIKPLRCDRENIGSDIRYPFFALQAGYQLMGDPDVRCGHVINYPLGYNDYAAYPPQALEKGTRDQHAYILRERRKLEAKRVRYE